MRKPLPLAGAFFLRTAHETRHARRHARGATYDTLHGRGQQRFRINEQADARGLVTPPLGELETPLNIAEDVLSVRHDQRALLSGG